MLRFRALTPDVAARLAFLRFDIWPNKQDPWALLWDGRLDF